MELNMLRKFETKSNRVKGLSFHPHRPWILASLHNGVIQLWDYRMEILLDSFEEHEGPVRGVDFHKTQPLFVSGGDDYKVKVWNYQWRRCLYTLHGHLDYIRTVQFHPNDQPWILSASDDQTVRVWNWQSRNCLLVLTGHNHYVMCAQWHPTEDLILSASLDQTIRVWDILGLRKRSTSIVEHQPTTGDVFGTVDAVVKFLLEGHSRGVNWASFHPTMNLVVSGADDREVKVWRLSPQRAWETTTFRGHLNNVSCVIFHPKENVIISNSEDKTLRVWDISRTHAPLCFRRENDRYWILASHPRLNLLAAGHDSGMIIFKLSRERPAFSIASDSIFYYKENNIKQYSISNNKDITLTQIRSTNSAQYNGKRKKRPRQLLYNPYGSAKDLNILIFYDGDESEYELYTLDRRGGQTGNGGGRGNAIAVAFVTRNRFAVLDNLGELSLKNMENATKRKIKIPERSVNYMFPGGVGRLLLRSQEWLTLFDVSSRKIIKELQIQSRFPIKFIHWSHDHTKVALLAKFSVMICDQDLNDICTVYENAKVKSGVWDKSGVFIYTTVTHMKYALPSGDHGIIKTLDEVVYIAYVKDNNVICLTREWDIKIFTIDNTEYIFKKALTERRYNDVQRLIEDGKLRGESIIAYLQKKGFPEVALRFVEDTQTRFSLALECGDIDEAFECSREINTKECWNRFGEAALMQGNYRFVTEAYKQTLNFEKLLYIFLITGNYPMMNKLLDIAKQKDDKMMRFNIALLTDNIEERIKSLKDCGQIGLAYLTAESYNKHELAQSLKQELGDKEIKMPKKYDGIKLPQPPKPVFGPFDTDSAYDWPRKDITKGFFDQGDLVIKSQAEIALEQKQKEKAAAAALESDEEDIEINNNEDKDNDNLDIDNWGVSTSIEKTAIKKKSIIKSTEEKEQPTGWNNAMDLELSDVEDEDDNKKNDDNTLLKGNGPGTTYFIMPTSGQTPSQKWLERAIAPADMIAAGSFDLAQESLHRQFGIVNFIPLKPYFLQIYTCSQAELPIIPNSSDISVGLYRKSQDSSQTLPAISLSLTHCHDYIKQAYILVSKGQFDEVIQIFRKVLHIIPLLIVENNDQLKDIRQLVKQCREYINALRVKVAANNESDKQRQFELSCYFTHFDLQDAHIFSGLFDAMKFGYTTNNFQTTAILCRRLLELAVSGRVKNDTSQQYIKKVEQVLKKCTQKNTDAMELKYKPHDYIGLCAYSLEPIERGEKFVKSPYCGSIFKVQYDGKLSPVDEIVRIGASAQGVSYSTL